MLAAPAAYARLRRHTQASHGDVYQQSLRPASLLARYVQLTSMSKETLDCRCPLLDRFKTAKQTPSALTCGDVCKQLHGAARVEQSRDAQVAVRPRDVHGPHVGKVAHQPHVRRGRLPCHLLRLQHTGFGINQRAGGPARQPGDRQVVAPARCSACTAMRISFNSCNARPLGCWCLQMIAAGYAGLELCCSFSIMSSVHLRICARVGMLKWRTRSTHICLQHVLDHGGGAAGCGNVQRS